MIQCIPILIILISCFQQQCHSFSPSFFVARRSRTRSRSTAGTKRNAQKDNDAPLVSRKQWLQSLQSSLQHAAAASFAIGIGLPKAIANAAETVGKDPLCNEGSCLGVWDGLLADCPHGAITMKQGAGCASSQDDTPGIFAEPWDYSEAPNNTLDYEEQIRLLQPAIELVSSKRGDIATKISQDNRYIKYLFIDGKTKEESIGEFYFTPNDTTVQFRVGAISNNGNLNNGSSGGGGGLFYSTASLKNLERCELIRKELRYTKIPVLRNRKRMLFFVESDLDSFGPSLGAAGEDIDAKMNIDEYPTELIQSFPSRRGQ